QTNTQAYINFDNRFGVPEDKIITFIESVQTHNLFPWGLCFHVGTHQKDIDAWDQMIAKASHIFMQCEKKGIALQVLDIGGGLPSCNNQDVPSYQAYTDSIYKSLLKHFNKKVPRIIMEPGRSIVAEAGILIAKIVSA